MEQSVEVQVIPTQHEAVHLLEQARIVEEPVARVEAAVALCLEVHHLAEVQRLQDLVLQVEEAALHHLDAEVADVNF